MLTHPQQLVPSQPYNITYFIRDHLDETTYYVQAKVYDVQSGEVLQTVELSALSANDRLYKATAQAPADPYGYGREIMVIATVYTDENFTQKSFNHEEQEHVYLIKAEQVVLGGGGGGETISFDYEELREVVTRILDVKNGEILEGLSIASRSILSAIQKLPKPQTIPVAQILGELTKLAVAIQKIPTDKTDLSAIQKQIDSLKDLVRVVLDDEVDLSPVEDKVNEIGSSIEKAISELDKAIDKKLVIHGEKTSLDKIRNLLTEMVGKQTMVPVDMRSLFPKEEEKVEDVDINNLFKSR